MLIKKEPGRPVNKMKELKLIKKGNFHDILNESGITAKFIYTRLGLTESGWYTLLRNVEDGRGMALFNVPERKMFLERMLNVQDLSELDFDRTKSKVYKEKNNHKRGEDRTDAQNEYVLERFE